MQNARKAEAGEVETSRRAAKTEALLQIGGAVAHELNNALTSILGNLQALSDQAQTWNGAPPHMERCLNLASRGAARVRAFAGRLQAATGRQPLDSSPVSLPRLIDRLTPEIRGAFDKTLQLQLNMPDGLWDVQTDPLQLEIAIQNLASNAIEAMPDGGELTIAAANVALDTVPAGVSIEPGRYVVLTVSDTGAGMSEEVRERAFELFFTTKSGGQRLGLGLTQVQSLATMSRGAVRLVSEPGRGTRVELYLPAAIAPAHDPALGTPALAATILVVEDDDDVREYVVESLQAARHTVIAVDHAHKALRYLELAPEKFDLLLTDGNLPGMDGYTLIQQVKPNLPRLAVLVMSASPHESLAGYRPEDRVEFLAKPMTKAALLARISALLQRQA